MGSRNRVAVVSIRRVEPEDGDLLRAVRLAALENEFPNVRIVNVKLVGSFCLESFDRAFDKEEVPIQDIPGSNRLSSNTHPPVYKQLPGQWRRLMNAKSL